MSDSLRLDAPDRQCYICLDGEERGGWVSPCRCAGSLAWVHRSCLLLWVREHESAHLGAVRCPQCLTTLILTPRKGLIVSTLELIDTRIYPVFKTCVFMVLNLIRMDVRFLTIGVSAMVHLHGAKHLKEILMSEDIINEITKLRLISCALIVVTYLPWEDWVLQVLRRASRLPVLNVIMPSDAPDRFKFPPPKRSMTRIFVSSILLSTWAKVCGEVFFRSIESNENRLIAGGCFYLAVKGVLYMYYQQKVLNRRKRMTVLPYQLTVSTQID